MCNLITDCLHTDSSFRLDIEEFERRLQETEVIQEINLIDTTNNLTTVDTEKNQIKTNLPKSASFFNYNKHTSNSPTNNNYINLSKTI